MAALYPLCFFIVLLKQGVAHSVAKFPPFISEDLDTLLDLLRKALATSWPWSIFRCRSAAMVFNWSVSASKMLPRSSITFCATSAVSLFLVSILTPSYASRALYLSLSAKTLIRRTRYT